MGDFWTAHLSKKTILALMKRKMVRMTIFLNHVVFFHYCPGADFWRYFINPIEVKPAAQKIIAAVK